MTLLFALVLTAAAAPPRTPAEQARLTQLAQALGRVHALHRLCTGPQDDLWRSRMGRMLDVEKADPALRQRLTDSFNAGFEAGGAGLTACSPSARAELIDAEHAAAERSSALAGSMPLDVA